MTRVDGLNNRYELVGKPKKPPTSGNVAVIYNNGPEIHISKELFESWQQVADSRVKQEELF